MHQKEPSGLHLQGEGSWSKVAGVFRAHCSNVDERNRRDPCCSVGTSDPRHTWPWGRSFLQYVPRRRKWEVARQLDTTLSSCLHGCGCSLASSTHHPNKHAQRRHDLATWLCRCHQRKRTDVHHLSTGFRQLLETSAVQQPFEHR